MHNLLHAPLSESELAAILAETAGRPALPPFGDTAWTAVRDNPAVVSWLAPLLVRAEAEAGAPLPELTDELYGDFFKTGARLPFENVYFERRRRLARAAMATLLGDAATSARLLPSFLRKFGEIMDEVSWTLPAHVWKEPSGRDPMQIDLFAAECANTCAELSVVFGSVLPPGFATRVRTRLREQVFKNFADREPPFFWATAPMNWNAVCHQGVLGAAFAVEEDHALVARMLVRAARGLPLFLSGFGEDGSTSEGPGYWSYGFGWFTELNAQLEHRTAGRLSFFQGDAKVARIARFAALLTFSGGHFVNFSDGHRTGRLNPGLLAHLGSRLGDPFLSQHGAALYRHLAGAGLDLDAQRRDFFNLGRLALRAPRPAVLANAREPEPTDVYFADYGALAARGVDARGHLWEFAAKAGHNAEHHNHNDCGGFLLNLDGVPALLEIGAPEYVHDFFNDRRYTFLAARSLGHSVPLVNGREQPAGREFAAEVLRSEVGGDRVEFVVDLTRCYPPEAGCLKLHRAFVFEKRAGRIEVTDTFELSGPGAFQSVVICDSGAGRDGESLRVPVGAAGALSVTPLAGTRLTEWESCAYSDHQGAPASIRRARFEPAAGEVSSGCVGFVIAVA